MPPVPPSSPSSRLRPLEQRWRWKKESKVRWEGKVVREGQLFVHKPTTTTTAGWGRTVQKCKIKSIAARRRVCRIYETERQRWRCLSQRPQTKTEAPKNNDMEENAHIERAGCQQEIEMPWRSMPSNTQKQNAKTK